MTTAASAIDLASVGAGLSDPVHHSQQIFRALLAAQSRPGCVQGLGGWPLPQAPGLSAAMGAALLTVLDSETKVWVAPDLASGALYAFLRFHTGAQESSERGNAAQAHFVVSSVASAEPALWNALNVGTDVAPHTSSSWWIDVPWMGADAAIDAPEDALWIRLSGPGIAGVQTIGVGGLGAAFWQWRQAQEALYPCGIDLLFCCGAQYIALPRSTHITLAD